MQHMPDKDFDKLFKDSFMDAEIEPSSDLWGNIAEHLEPQKKRSFPILWMAAASITVVASVLLFSQNADKVYLQGTSSKLAWAQTTNEVQITPVTNTPTNKTAIKATVAAHKISEKVLVKTVANQLVNTKVNHNQENNFVTVQPSTQIAHLPIKKAEVKVLDVTPAEEEVPTHNTQEIVIASLPKSTTTDFNSDEDFNNNKKGIRNVGDLVNYVVDKVDKRDKKIIKFDTDDDDNSSIIGLNIGFLKLNKKNK